MTRAKVALVECDRLIEMYDGKYGWAATYTDMLRIGRDVLTRHTRRPLDEWCCYHHSPCPVARPWLDLLAPEPTP